MAIKQVSVFLENKKGRLYELAKLLGENGVNMQALSVAETADYGVVRLIADDPKKAVQVLRENGFTVSETDVIAVKVKDEPGGLAAVLEALSKNDINVEYLYCFSGPEKGSAIDVMRVENTGEAERVLKEAGFEVV
jgi:hypothetical protein